MKTVLFDWRVADRWQRRGGTNPPKRSGRYTKPGLRPRARRKTEAKPKKEALMNEALHVVYNGQTTHLRQSLCNPGWLDSTVTSTGSGVYDIHPYVQASPYTITIGNDQYVTSDVSYGTSATDVTSNDLIINPKVYVVPSTGGPWIPADTPISSEITFPSLIPHSDVSGWVTFEPFTYTLVTQGPWVHRKRLRDQLLPQRAPCRADRVDFGGCTQAELTALSLLKKMVSEAAWRTYLKYGFVNVRGKSGLDYQIRRSHWHVLVRSQGLRVAELCVGLYSRSQMPPTDEVIARMVMAECDEKELWRRANVDIVAEHKRYHSNSQNHEHLERLAAAA